MKIALAWTLSTVVCASACGGSTPQPKAECPSGTYLSEGNCLPLTEEEAEQRMRAPTTAQKYNEPSSTPSPSSASSPTSPSIPPGPPTPYDKEAVQMALRRSAAQARTNCGAATDDEGKASGPWGKTSVTVTLGRNGRAKGVAVQPPFDGKPVGRCISQAFGRIVFPPYAGDNDATVDWDVEILQPGKTGK